MAKASKEIIELPERELKRWKQMSCSICEKNLKDKAIVIRYPKTKVQVPLCEKCYNESEEEHIDTIARVAQISGEYYK